MMGYRQFLSGVLNLWVVVGAVAFACVLSTLVLSFLMLSRSSTTVLQPATAVLNVTPLPSATQPLPTSSEAPATPTAQVYPTPLPGVVSINAYVQVVGTGGEGLRLRVEPGLSGQIRLVANEAEVFLVSDGPQEVDGYTWWYLVGPYDEARQGWAVSNYLSVIQNPD